MSFSRLTTAASRLCTEELSLRLSTLRLRNAESELVAHLASARHEEMLVQK